MGLPGPLKGLMTAMHGPVYKARLAELVRRIRPHLHEGDRVLDVGCGQGTLGRALMDAPGPAVTVEGLERRPRDGEPIRVIAYEGLEGGKSIPLPDNSFDVVILADVLHHERDPDRLIAECARIARRLLIIKDHQVKGPLAQQRIAFMDWAANAPYGVPCLYRYNTPDQWRDLRERHGLGVRQELNSMRLYPFGWNLVFGRRLQYLGVLEVHRSAD
jgi:ubiquinone/menaquinone biosynthesis C-methylase UbiE